MVTQVPPMICSEPQKFSEKLHEIKECNWQVNEGPYELVYLRPVLFYGRHGAVAAQGQVGNQECSAESHINFAIPENKEEVKEEPKPDETEDKDEESEGREKMNIDEGKQEEITKGNCITPYDQTETETKKVKGESGDPTQSSESGIVSVILDEDKQNGENPKIDFKEHNNEPNNEHTQEITDLKCVTSDDKIETETPNEAEESEEQPAQSSEIGTVSAIQDKDKQNGENQEIEHNDEVNNCVTPDDKVIPKEAGDSEEKVAQSSEIGTVIVIPNEDKQNGENQEKHFNEQNDKHNNEVTHKEKVGVTYVTTNNIKETSATTEKIEDLDRKEDN